MDNKYYIAKSSKELLFWEKLLSKNVSHVREMLREDPALAWALKKPDKEMAFSPLCCACQIMDTEIVQALLEAGADLNLGYNFDDFHTGLHYKEMPLEGLLVNRRNKPESLAIMKLLLEKGADADQAYARRGGMTPLILLSSYSNNKSREKLKLLMEHGADPNKKDEAERAPIHYASAFQPRMIKLLVQVGADINNPGPFGITAIHHAYVSEKVRTVRILLSNGADPDIEDEAGNNADQSNQKQSLGKTEKQIEISEIVEEHRKKVIKDQLMKVARKSCGNSLGHGKRAKPPKM